MYSLLHLDLLWSSLSTDSRLARPSRQASDNLHEPAALVAMYLSALESSLRVFAQQCLFNLLERQAQETAQAEGEGSSLAARLVGRHSVMQQLSQLAIGTSRSTTLAHLPSTIYGSGSHVELQQSTAPSS